MYDHRLSKGLLNTMNEKGVKSGPIWNFKITEIKSF